MLRMRSLCKQRHFLFNLYIMKESKHPKVRISIGNFQRLSRDVHIVRRKGLSWFYFDGMKLTLKEAETLLKEFEENRGQ